MNKIKYDKYGETVYQRKLDNGLEIFIIEDTNFDCIYTYLTVKFGASHLYFDDFDVIPGSAHFLEHMVFKLENGDRIEEFSKKGAKINAMTSYSDTTYYFECHEKFEENFINFIDMLDSLFITEELVEREKNIIIEEIDMYKSDINMEIGEEFIRNIYSSNPILHDIGGTEINVRSITLPHLVELYEKFYGNSNRILVICGKVDIKYLSDFFDNYERTNSKKQVILTRKQIEEKKECVNEYKIAHFDIPIPMHYIGIKLDPKTYSLKKEFTYQFMFGMLIGSSSKLKDKLRHAGLLSSQFYFEVNFEYQAFYLEIFNSTKKIDEYEKKILNIINDTHESFFDMNTFTRLKKAFLGEFIFGLNQIRTKIECFVAYKIDGYDLFEIVELINEITLDECVEAFNTLKESSKTILKVLPK